MYSLGNQIMADEIKKISRHFECYTIVRDADCGLRRYQRAFLLTYVKVVFIYCCVIVGDNDATPIRCQTISAIISLMVWNRVQW